MRFALNPLAVWTLAVMAPFGEREFVADGDLELVLGTPISLELPAGQTTTTFRFQAKEWGVAFVRARASGGELELTAEVPVYGVTETDRVSGGRRWAVAGVALAAGDDLIVTVLASGPGPLNVQLESSRESDSMVITSGEARQALERSKSLFAQGDRDGALSYLVDVCEEIMSRPGALESAHVVDALFSCAAEVYTLGDCAFAIKIQESLLTLRTRTHPADHDAVLKIDEAMAIAMSPCGQEEKGLALMESVVARRRAISAPGDLDLVRGLMNLAAELESAGRYEEMLSLVSELEAALPRLPEGSRLASAVRHKIAVTYANTGRLAPACELMRISYDDMMLMEPPHHPYLISIRSNLATLLDESGRLHESLELRETGVRILEAFLPPGAIEILRERQILAEMRLFQGDVAGARALIETAFAHLGELPPDHDVVRQVRATLGAVLLQSGESEQAVEHMEAVADVMRAQRGPDDPHFLNSLHNLALTRIQLGQLEQGRALLEEVLVTRERTVTPNDINLATTRSGLASVLIDLDETERASELLRQTIEVFVKILPVTDARLHSALRDQTTALVKLGRVEEAERAGLQLAVAIRKTLLDSAQHSSAREVEERTRAALPEVILVDDLAEGRTQVVPASAAMRAETFALRETARGIGWLAARLLRLVRDDPSVTKLNIELHAAQSRVVASALGMDADELARAVRARDTLQRKLSSISESKLSIELAAITPTAIAKQLDEGTVVISFRTRAEEEGPMSAHVLTWTGELSSVDLAQRAEMRSAVEDWRNSLGVSLANRGVTVDSSAPGNPDAIHAAGKAIFDLTLGRLELPPNTRRLVLLPDDCLHLVPFDALPCESGLVGDRYDAVTVMPTLWSYVIPEDAAPGELVVLAGGIDYDGRERTTSKSVIEGASTEGARSGPWVGGFTPLPGTDAEVLEIARISDADLDHTIVLRGKDPTPDALSKLAPRTRYLHLATHGYFARESAVNRAASLSPMVLTGLALANANLSEGGQLLGVVTGEELSTWDLAGCELAVLSACETNIGLRRAGQGIHSLQTALHAAGVRTAITSLWKVNDATTRQLMGLFYRKLWHEGLGKADALWQAKMALREEGLGLKDWAAWVLTGDPD